MKIKSFIICSLICVFLCSCGANKPKIDPYLGTWNLVIEDTPQGNIKAEMTISNQESNDYIVEVKSDVGSFQLEELVLADSKMKGNFIVQGMDWTLSGTFQGNDFEGFVSGEGFLFDANGKKATTSN